MESKKVQELDVWLKGLEDERTALISALNDYSDHVKQLEVKNRLYQIEAWLDGVYANKNLRF
ncbi:hypothetical protein RZN22_13085 [Bacillaceae bacterium S4-13-58]